MKTGRAVLAGREGKTGISLRLILVVSCALSIVASFQLGVFRFGDIEDFQGISDSPCIGAPNGLAAPKERHVLYGLSGNESSLFGELEVSLKSVLLNAPPEDPLTIHILADQDAYAELRHVFVRKMQWSPSNQTIRKFPTQITIKTYNVQQYQDRWTKTIERCLSAAHNKTTHSLYRHTIGAYFRLFAADVLPSDIDNIAYLDADVVMMSNLGSLWQQLDQDSYQSSEPLFFWGESRCSGFMVLRLKMQEQLWSKYSEAPDHTIEKILRPWPVVDDQFLLQAVHRTFPDSVGKLDPVWDVSVLDGPWKRDPSLLYQHRSSGVGILHFNGGTGSSKATYYESSGKPVHYREDPLWNLAKYYVDLPWSWAFFQLSSRVSSKGYSFPLEIQYSMVDESFAN